MADFKKLEDELLAAIGAAKDDAALEALRVGALGKKGSISELLKTLGTMTPEERKQEGPLINGLRDRVSEAITQKRDTLKRAATAERLVGRQGRRDAPLARKARSSAGASIR